MVTVIEYLFVVVLGITAYQVFLSDYFREKIQSLTTKRSAVSNADKIARVKLVSDDALGIEKFITANAEHLSDEMVQKLVARIESIKTDRVIDADTMLKQRIDSLVPKRVAASTEEEEPTRAKRRGSR